MNLEIIDPPRIFQTGFDEPIFLSDCAHITLEPDEQVTFFTETGAEYDVARKDWGFYATPSLNGRLQRFGLRGVLVKNRIGQYFVMLIKKGWEGVFDRYLESEKLKVITWLDNSEILENLETKLALP